MNRSGSEMKSPWRPWVPRLRKGVPCGVFCAEAGCRGVGDGDGEVRDSSVAMALVGGLGGMLVEEAVVFIRFGGVR